MKMLKKVMVVATLSLSLFGLNSQTDAATTTHLVKSGETYWTIAQKYGLSVNYLKSINNKSSNVLYSGQKLVLPRTSITAADKELMARLVSAEAKGEPYAGKVAVATVILNRVDSVEFPNSVKGVIYQNVNGHYAFTPVQNGTINQAADAGSKKAVEEALTLRGKGNGSLYFYNPKTSTSRWVDSREATVWIGKHKFAR
ncbi:cell wall hydrolase [Schinkia azotoformans]|uniref:cell wall hydrolase n=1 Tax=Schinkia azotoformans TaxID=1454 RepID=UPI002DB86255|nr:cell wall hydrolase [Schinkia azotoformans]MEC1740192.1 cell wall hydrolase [Schinkia azotoformans]MEC1765566.1 cell wall hydrolase [Schinkia azotoformans]MEC1770775.1 cell wall hydrolase [Schinkia azotoformans]MEC1786948.1 cell wall hydrolase [Schinkia azotoformans]MED4367923.1 cell wall hydrolase [Schinkia azotoformans]